MSRDTSHRTTPGAVGQHSEPVAIVGAGLRFPGGSESLEEFEEFLRTGSSGIGPLPEDRWDVAAFTPNSPDDKGKIRASGGGYLDRIDLFDAGFFNISPKEAQYIDPQQRMLLETAWQALEQANIDPTPLRGGNGGVFIGASSVDYALDLEALPYEDLDGSLAAGMTLFPLSGRLSYFLGWRGPSLSVDTACSSSLAALHLAVTALRRGECDIALGGGVNALHNPRVPVMFSNAQMLAPDGQCKTFDESADGYARAEGCGVLVLKRLSDATTDGDQVLAVIRGTGVGQDGDSAGLTVPNGPAQERVLGLALADAGLGPGDIQYVEAHGTGTPLGDPIELGAISNVFADSHTKDDPLVVGSVKTNLGHLEPASGLVGVIKAMLQIRSRTIFPHLNFSTPSERIPWEVYPVRVPTECEPWKAPVRRAAVNSFGFAGTIGAVVLEQAPARTADQERVTGAAAVFTLSAKSTAALREQAERYATFVVEHPELDVAALCHTANVGRAHFSHRVAAPVTDRADLLRVLDATRQPDLAVEPAGIRKVAFMFTGQGAQYAGMGAVPYERFELFRQVVDECDRLFAPQLGRSVRDLLLGVGDDLEAIDQTLYTQSALFTLEYGLARQWMSWGVKPNVLIGHSIGEVVAATVAGLFSLPDAVTLVAARARLMQSVSTEGGMASVSAPVEQVQPLLEDYPDLAVAAVNGPEQCVISGASEALAEVSARLDSDGVRVRSLAVSHAFHSPLMAEVFDDFRTALEAITFREPTISLVSNLTGKVARMREIGTVDYWVRHIGEPVRFLHGMRAVAKRGRHAFVEMGPSAMLCALGKQCVSAEDHLWLASLRRQDKTGDATLRAFADFYAAGLPVDWTGYHAGARPSPGERLPTYAFQRKSYWLPIPKTRTTRGPDGPASHPLLGQRTPTSERAAPVGELTPPVGEPAPPVGEPAPQTWEFTAEFTLAELGELASHRLGGKPALPPAAWADLLFALQDAVFGHTRGAVQELRLPEPLVLTDDQAVRLTTRLSRAGKGLADVEVTGVVAEGEAGVVAGGGETQERVRTYVRARITTETDPRRDSELHALADQLGSPSERADGADVSTDLAAVGRGFDAATSRLLSVARHPDGVVTAELAGGEPVAVEQLPAALLESALIGAVALEDAGPVHALQAADRVRLFKKPRGERLGLVARVRADGRDRLADLLLLEGDEPVAEVLGAVLSLPEGPGGAPEFVHRVEWLRRSLPQAQDLPAERHVVLAGTAAAGDHTAPPAVLTALSDSVPAGRRGQDDTQPVRLTLAADTATLYEALTDTSVTDLAWFWRPTAGALSYQRLRAELEHNFRTLLEVLAAPSLADTRRGTRVWLVTERAQWLPGDQADGDEQLTAAALWGFGQVLLNEHPKLKTTLVDVDRDGHAAASALLEEWRAPEPGEYQIAYRAGSRHVRRLLAGDGTPTWPFEVRTAPDAAPRLVPAEERAPEGDEVRVRVAAAALTSADVPDDVTQDPAQFPDAEAAEPQRTPVTATACVGSVVAAGPEARIAAGTRVSVRQPRALGSSVTVPVTAVAPLEEGTRPTVAAALAAGATGEHAAEVETYAPDEVDEALRTLSAHPGPVVVTLAPDPALAPETAPDPTPGTGLPTSAAGTEDEGFFDIRGDRTYVVTGGLGGLGLVTARKLVDLGARRLALVSRSGRPTGEAADVLTELSQRAEVSLLRADMGSEPEVRALVAELHQLEHPVGGIVHAAGAVGSTLVSGLDWPVIEEQLAPKVYGGWLLHEAASSFPELDFFTVYSSIASVAGVKGGVGQAHYAAAFSFLDGLMRWRSQQRLPALSVNWGSWGRVGVSARLDTSVIEVIERGGVRLFSPSWGLRALHQLWRRPEPQRLVNVFDWPAFVAQLPVTNALFDRVAEPANAAANTATDMAELLARPKPERMKLIGRMVAERVAAALHIGSVEEVEPAAEFVTLGLDSVMGMDVRSGLEADFGLSLPASLTFDHPSVRRITEFVDNQLTNSAEGTA